MTVTSRLTAKIQRMGEYEWLVITGLLLYNIYIGHGVKRELKELRQQSKK